MPYMFIVFLVFLSREFNCYNLSPLIIRGKSILSGKVGNTLYFSGEFNCSNLSPLFSCCIHLSERCVVITKKGGMWTYVLAGMMYVTICLVLIMITLYCKIFIRSVDLFNQVFKMTIILSEVSIWCGDQDMVLEDYDIKAYLWRMTLNVKLHSVELVKIYGQSPCLIMMLSLRIYLKHHHIEVKIKYQMKCWIIV